ncbi:hypothetical protein [Actinacidiphila acididurans]|uniref:Chromosome partition protein Smc n=1 Tax=Actinacidiphila acididurans TaxID=2784346 RepID=A0ABS2TTM0_9ACTN|nr:hypothetical protein [Actinacidiphila acididurans]MBM9506674.1 hypothetical protein [Actinacidiphila acididurans]
MTSESAESAQYDGRLRDLEAEAFRAGRTLAEHGEQLASIRDQQRTAFGNIDSLADAIGAPGERSIARRLEALEGAVGALRETQIEHGRELQSHGRMLEQLAGAVGSLVEGQARILERLDEIAPPRQD